MHLLLEVVLLVVVVVAVAAVARRFGLLAPIMLWWSASGCRSCRVSRCPTSRPEFVIVGILPPLLYVAALEISVPAFRFNLRPIMLLAVGHVLFIAALVGSRCT